MSILDEIMDAPPILKKSELEEVSRLAAVIGVGDSCTLDCAGDFATVLSIVLLAGLEALESK